MKRLLSKLCIDTEQRLGLWAIWPRVQTTAARQKKLNDADVHINIYVQESLRREKE